MGKAELKKARAELTRYKNKLGKEYGGKTILQLPKDLYDEYMRLQNNVARLEGEIMYEES